MQPEAPAAQYQTPSHRGTNEDRGWPRTELQGWDKSDSVGEGEKGLTLAVGDDGVSVFLHHGGLLLYHTKTTGSQEQNVLRGGAVRPFTLPRLLQGTAGEKCGTE